VIVWQDKARSWIVVWKILDSVIRGDSWIIMPYSPFYLPYQEYLYVSKKFGLRNFLLIPCSKGEVPLVCGIFCWHCSHVSSNESHPLITIKLVCLVWNTGLEFHYATCSLLVYTIGAQVLLKLSVIMLPVHFLPFIVGIQILSKLGIKRITYCIVWFLFFDKEKDFIYINIIKDINKRWV